MKSCDGYSFPSLAYRTRITIASLKLLTHAAVFDKTMGIATLNPSYSLLHERLNPCHHVRCLRHDLFGQCFQFFAGGESERKGMRRDCEEKNSGSNSEPAREFASRLSEI